MSYTTAPAMSDVEPSSLMLYDIAALQYLYGANTSYKAGNDLWRWNANETFRYCIWDGGGIDTLDASNQARRVIIDLNPGTFSSLGSYKGGDAIDNLSIAYNCWIENANGGSGNDTITGNQLNNRIDGGGGNDTITGGDGNDTLLGGAGNDTFYDGVGDDTASGGAGDDTFYADFGADSYDGGSGFDTIYFGTGIASGVAVNLANPGAGSSQAQGDTYTGIEKFVGTGYNDSFVGDANANWFVGGYGDDTFYGSAGADTFDGGEYWDTLSYAGSAAGVSVNLMTGVLSGGDAEGDKIASSIPERPDLYANSIENLIGSDFDDVLVSGSHAGTIRGGAGNDILYQGMDFLGIPGLYGGTGNDLYYLIPLPNSWASPIAMENPGEGYDEIRATGDVFLNNSEIEKVVYLGTGNFNFSGNIFAQTVTGGAGNDVLIGGGGADTLIGGDGNDVIYYAPGAAIINGGAGVDTVQLVDTYFDLQAIPTAFIDVERFVGTQNLDEMLGNSADNTFIGGAGGDTFDGRGGYDTVIYKGSAADYTVTDQGGVITVAPRRTELLNLEGIDTLKNIENIVFTGEVAQ